MPEGDPSPDGRVLVEWEEFEGPANGWWMRFPRFLDARTRAVLLDLGLQAQGSVTWREDGLALLAFSWPYFSSEPYRLLLDFPNRQFRAVGVLPGGADAVAPPAPFADIHDWIRAENERRDRLDEPNRRKRAEEGEKRKAAERRDTIGTLWLILAIAAVYLLVTELN